MQNHIPQQTFKSKTRISKLGVNPESRTQKLKIQKPGIQNHESKP